MQIYFIGGIAGVGKTSHFLNKLKSRNLACFETDSLRPGYDLKLPNLSVDDFAWIAVRHIIKYRLFLPENNGLVFMGVACEPKLIKQLEYDEPKILIRTALIGTSKQFHRFERYPKPEPAETSKSDRLKREMRELKLANCKYFDLIKCASVEEQAKDLVKISEKEVDEYVENIIKDHLL